MLAGESPHILKEHAPKAYKLGGHGVCCGGALRLHHAELSTDRTVYFREEGRRLPLTVAGRQTRLSELRGKVVVLNFWASYCGSCVEEMPDLDRLQGRIRSRGGIVLAVSVDENCGNYEDFLKKYPVRFRLPANQRRKFRWATELQ